LKQDFCPIFKQIRQYTVHICSVTNQHHFDPDLHPDPSFHYYADTDPTFHFEADPDPIFNFDAVWILLPSK
jgi:hypothetical protein